MEAEAQLPSDASHASAEDFALVETESPAAVFQDACWLYSDALEEIARGKLRNASEKAWGATKRATDALILARTGEEPATTSYTSRALHVLVPLDTRVESLVGRYHPRAGYLHGQCFYDGMCEPAEDVEWRIRETDAYINDAQELAADG